MITMPIISFIIPIYKVEDYIGRCLSSIYDQKIDNTLFEVIAVNDGTPDNSMSIVLKFQKEYSNLQIVEQNNSGLSVARNSGLRKAKGEYIWFVDSDDWLAEGSIITILKYIDEYKPTLISSRLLFTWGDGRVRVTQNISSTVRVPNYKYIKECPVGASQRYIIKASLIKENKLSFYPGIYHEDAEFNPQIIYYAKDVLLIKEALYHYYQRENSIMTSWKLKNTLDYLLVASRIKDFSDNISDSKYRKALEFFSFKLLFRAFPYQKVCEIKEVRDKYLENKNKIKKTAVTQLFKNCYLTRKERLIALICFISPMLLLKIQNKKYKR